MNNINFNFPIKDSGLYINNELQKFYTKIDQLNINDIDIDTSFMWYLLYILKNIFKFNQQNISKYYKNGDERKISYKKKNHTISSYIPIYQQKIFNLDFIYKIFNKLIKLYKIEHNYKKGFPNSFYQKVIINNNNNAKVCIIGDIHSSLHSLIDILEKLNKDDYFNNQSFKLNNNRYIIFLGDIVDRGPYSIELLVIIYSLKIINFNNVYIINGNHENTIITVKYGLYEEFKLEYSCEYEQLKTFYDKLNELWYYSPVCIILKFCNKTYHLCHGSFDQSMLDETNSGEFEHFINLDIHNQKFNISNEINKQDILWSDMSCENTEPNTDSDRGYGKLIGKNIIKEYLKKFKLSSIISGHQDFYNVGLIPNKFSNDMFKNTTHKKFKLYTLDNCKINKPSIKIELNDFNALVTSTASYSKYNKRNLSRNCYIELEKINKPSIKICIKL